MTVGLRHNRRTMAKAPARRRRLLAHRPPARGDRGADDPRSAPALPSGASGATEPPGDDPPSPPTEETAEEAAGEDGDPPALLPAPSGPPPGWRAPLLPAVAANPGPLPEPLPPRLDAVVRRLRDDLLDAGGGAGALADEICARHRDRLREALGLTDGRPAPRPPVSSPVRTR